ncbi:MAG: glycosyltransferase [Acidobacteriota bacterium]|nr:glycosyltransferase [Acidobacteriota bacterium]
MKIAYIVKEFPRLSETFILTELLQLEALGHEVVVFSRHEGSAEVPHEGLSRLRAEVVQLQPLLRDRLWESFESHLAASRKLGESYDRMMEQAISLRSRNEMRYWIVAAALARQLRDRRVDLIHGHFATGSASMARYAAGLAALPYTFTAHAKDIYAETVSIPRLRNLCLQAAAVVTVSDANVAYLQQIAPGAHIRRIYNGVDLQRLPELPPPPLPRSPRILFVGRFVEKKGLPVLLDAAAALKAEGRELRLRLVGEGPLEEELRRRAAALDLLEVVEFVGPASQEEVIGRHFPESAVFAMPAVIAADGDRDGLPTTLLEAAACGVPMVSTAVTGIPEILGHGEAGLIVAPGDAEALAGALGRIFDQPAIAARLATAARRRAEALFDARRNVAQLAALFEQAAGKHSGAGSA